MKTLPSFLLLLLLIGCRASLPVPTDDAKAFHSSIVDDCVAAADLGWVLRDEGTAQKDVEFIVRACIERHITAKQAAKELATLKAGNL